MVDIQGSNDTKVRRWWASKILGRSPNICKSQSSPEIRVHLKPCNTDSVICRGQFSKSNLLVQLKFTEQDRKPATCMFTKVPPPSSSSISSSGCSLWAFSMSYQHSSWSCPCDYTWKTRKWCSDESVFLKASGEGCILDFRMHVQDASEETFPNL